MAGFASMVAAVAGCGCVGATLIGAFLIWFFVLPVGGDPRYEADRADPVRNWSHGVIALYRGDVGDPGYWERSDAVRHLAEGWSTPDREELDALIDRYHRGESSPGWDLTRLVFLARLGAGTGWYTEEESWAHIARARAAAHASVQDWAALADAIERGKSEWYANTDELDEQLASVRLVREWAMESVIPSVPWR